MRRIIPNLGLAIGLALAPGALRAAEEAPADPNSAAQTPAEPATAPPAAEPGAAGAPDEEGAVERGGLSREEAAEMVADLWRETSGILRRELAAEIAAKSITHQGKTMRWLERTFGDAPEGGRSLWISMHGGGGAPARVNDSQWQNQIRLYTLEEGIYVAPRAPTDTWNLWHEGHIDGLFDRLIAGMVATRGVDPNRVYLLGYSAGGDGVWQLAPRMADRFAAAAMMAGHPNEASLLGLRNLPFAILMGANDAAFDRNKIAAERAGQLGALRKADPDGYPHFVRIYERTGHWMNGKDAEALPWMATHTRQPWPKKVVWLQDDVTHERFYWLQVPPEAATVGRRIVAEVSGRTITLGGDVPAGLTVHLSDALLDLDEPVTIRHGDQVMFEGLVPRTRAAIIEGLKARPDPLRCPTASIVLE